VSPLARAPGTWRWEQRRGSWWRINDDLHIEDGPYPNRDRGWFNMPCWNGLSGEQQHRLITVGNLPIGFVPEGGWCPNGAEVAIETQHDEAPGPRFYCVGCGITYLRLFVPPTLTASCVDCGDPVEPGTRRCASCQVVKDFG